ncbi:SDR family NAD(P)-dependent oxidoreductase [Actinophytocola sp.]|uniref:SDR family NAD(P)-dependent oxidoreductase n=1 Tax=Actinophytocola sp. TaxID=1872138 RepID=UPI002D53C9FA|nr:SDR family NAD(P)-dependent oxidoreductase [Actinophytocola sp.]HYQ69118.1 SDR family NAD(P)-dependent oxidoreductase [Actinophytocola sp.]
MGMLTDKIALVTGASRGIGAAAARLFTEEGATVVLTARTESALKAIADDLPGASYVVADLGDVASIERAVATVVERHGRLDIAFNNGAVGVPPHPVADFPEDDFDLVLRVNLKGVFYAVSAEVKAMAGNGGAIVNTSSVGSLMGNPALPAYGAAKRAVNSLTESAAVTYAKDGIRVNAIAPGLTMTEMVEDWNRHDPGVIDRIVAGTPLGRAAQPEEIAQAAAWLLSDRASFVTGVVLPVTGGTAV